MAGGLKPCEMKWADNRFIQHLFQSPFSMPSCDAGASN